MGQRRQRIQRPPEEVRKACSPESRRAFDSSPEKPEEDLSGVSWRASLNEILLALLFIEDNPYSLLNVTMNFLR
jgi:hypothetical protein